MSILSDFEDRVGHAVEGAFAGVFRSPVQPAELAHALAKEAGRRKVVGVGKVFAPTLYNVLLSPDDDEKLGGFADTLAGELETYLVSYAREHSYTLAARPVVRFIVDDELKLGRFDVIGELLSLKSWPRNSASRRRMPHRWCAPGCFSTPSPQTPTRSESPRPASRP